MFNVVSDTRYDSGKKLYEHEYCLEIVLIFLLQCLGMAGIFPRCGCVCLHSEFDSSKPFFLQVFFMVKPLFFHQPLM